MKNLTILSVLLGAAVLLTSFKDDKKKPVTRKKSASTTSVAAISRKMAYPVAGRGSSVQSFWGADRDGGARSHRGIDIFASKGTPVVAISDGIIVNKSTTRRGGKVLWLKSTNQPLTAYYAHLDKHLVKQGQRVRKGQVIGTVGKTGNARTTPPHLHFGIYTKKGAVNPYPYVKNSPKVAIAKKTTKKKLVTAKKSSRKKSTAVANRAASKSSRSSRR